MIKHKQTHCYLMQDFGTLRKKSIGSLMRAARRLEARRFAASQRSLDFEENAMSGKGNKKRP